MISESRRPAVRRRACGHRSDRCERRGIEWPRRDCLRRRNQARLRHRQGVGAGRNSMFDRPTLSVRTSRCGREGRGPRTFNSPGGISAHARSRRHQGRGCHHVRSNTAKAPGRSIPIRIPGPTFRPGTVHMDEAQFRHVRSRASVYSRQKIQHHTIELLDSPRT